MCFRNKLNMKYLLPGLAVTVLAIFLSVFFLQAEWIIGVPVLNTLCLICLISALIIIAFQVKERLFPNQGQIISSICIRLLNIASAFYCVTLAAALVRFTLTTTMFPSIMDSSLTDFINILSLVLLDMSILTFAISLSKVKNRFQVIFEIAILVIFYIWHSQMSDCVLIQYLIILMLGATEQNFRRILEVYLSIKVPIFVLMFYASQNGYIYDKRYFRFDGTRYAVGSINFTDCAAYILFMMIAYCILRQKYRSKDWQSFIDYPILLLIAEYCHHLTGARSNTAWMFITIGLTFLFHIKIFIKLPVRVKNILHYICYALTPIYLYIFGIIYAAVQSFNTGRGWLASWTDKLSDSGLRVRLQVPQTAINNYGISLTGCWGIYPDEGYGGKVFSGDLSDYTYIDMSYMRILILYGILITIILMASFLYTNIRCTVQRQYYLFSIMILIAFTGLIEQHLTEFHYDILLLATFAQFENNRCNKIKIKKSIKRQLSILP